MILNVFYQLSLSKIGAPPPEKNDFLNELVLILLTLQLFLVVHFYTSGDTEG